MRVDARGLQVMFQDGCAKIRMPNCDGAREALLINSSGGLTGGDRLDWTAECLGGALTVTTQACEKIYRARDGEAETRVSLKVGPGAALEWLPQETILFDGGALRRTLDADVEAGGRLLAMEAVVLGRTAMGETVTTGAVHDRWRIRQEGRLVFADDLRLTGDLEAVGAGRAVLAGARAFASILMIDPDAPRRLAAVREALGETGGASAFEGRLFARIAAPDGFALRAALIPALEALRDGRPLPRAWRI